MRATRSTNLRMWSVYLQTHREKKKREKCRVDGPHGLQRGRCRGQQ
jgi:hypothetical protein